jgi:hypothetical protein
MVAFLGKLAHDAQDFIAQFGVNAGRFVEGMTSGCIARARAIATRCC